MKKLILLVLLLLPVYLAGCTQSREDMEALKSKVSALEKGQETIIAELKNIKNLVQGRRPTRQPFKQALFNIGDDPFKGLKDAVVTLVDFSDYQ